MSAERKSPLELVVILVGAFAALLVVLSLLTRLRRLTGAPVVGVARPLGQGLLSGLFTTSGAAPGTRGSGGFLSDITDKVSASYAGAVDTLRDAGASGSLGGGDVTEKTGGGSWFTGDPAPLALNGPELGSSLPTWFGGADAGSDGFDGFADKGV